MEDRAKCFHLSASIVRSSRKKDILTDRNERESREKRYISQFSRMLTVLQSQGSKSNNKKRILHVDVFRSESVCVLFCYLLGTL